MNAGNRDDVSTNGIAAPGNSGPQTDKRAKNTRQLDKALALAQLGYAVLPLSVKREPCLKAWPTRATSDPDEIRRIWAETQPGHVGILTGSRSGLVVIDLDVKNGKNGVETWDGLVGLIAPYTPTTATRSGVGQHIYYRTDERFTTLHGKVGPGVDVKADPGYVTAYDTPRALADVEPMPEHVASVLRAVEQADVREVDRPATIRKVGPKGFQEALKQEIDAVRTAEPGQRNDTLNRSAYCLGQLVGVPGLDEGEVREALQEAGMAAAPDEPEKVYATVESGLTGGMQNPRTVTETTPDAPLADTPDELEKRILERVEAIQVDQEARRRVALASEPPSEPWVVGTLADLMARDEEAPQARVEGLIPWNASTQIIAMRKTGKTTFVLALARSLITGEDFLGREVVPIGDGRRVGLLNYEVSPRQMEAWAFDAGIPPDRLFIANLRGTPNPLTTDARRAEMAALLRDAGVEVLIVDPFGRAYSGESQNDNGEVQAWLMSLERFARAEVGALDLVLTVHAGWGGEHARGASALEDWGDSLIYLTRDEDTDARFMRADGRDVSVPEDQLLRDPETRELRMAGSNRRRSEAKADRLMDVMLQVVEETPGLSGNKVEEAMKERGCHLQKGDSLSKAAKEAERRGLLVRIKSGQAWLHYRPEDSPESGPGVVL